MSVCFNEKSFNYRLFFFGSLFLICTFFKQVGAQDLKGEEGDFSKPVLVRVEKAKVAQSEKKHFDLIFFSDTVNQSIYYQALLQFDHLDKYRSKKNRREIMFSDGNAATILYSAEELKQKYGRPASPLTKDDDSLIPEVEFQINSTGRLKENLK